MEVSAKPLIPPKIHLARPPGACRLSRPCAPRTGEGAVDRAQLDTQEPNHNSPTGSPPPSASRQTESDALITTRGLLLLVLSVGTGLLSAAVAGISTAVS